MEQESVTNNWLQGCCLHERINKSLRHNRPPPI